MHRYNRRSLWWWRLSILAAGSALFLGGCDPTLRATVEDGIISSSTAFLGSLLQAILQLVQEAHA